MLGIYVTKKAMFLNHIAARPAAGDLAGEKKQILIRYLLLSLVALSLPCALNGATKFFHTGFNGISIVENDSHTAASLSGKDTVTGYAMEDILKVPGMEKANLGSLGKLHEHLEFAIINGGNERGNVLNIKVTGNQSKPYTRGQWLWTFLKGEDKKAKQLFVSYKMKLHPAYAHAIRATKEWFQIFEMKTHIVKGNSKTLEVKVFYENGGLYPLLDYRILPAGNVPNKKITVLWDKKNRDFSIPFGEWFRVDVFLKHGANDNGDFYYAINGKPVFYIHDQDLSQKGATMRQFECLKIYQDLKIIDWMIANGTPCEVWFDDIEIWSDLPPSIKLPAK